MSRLKRSRIRPVSTKRAAKLRRSAFSKREAIITSRGRCQARISAKCDGVANDVHHKLAKSQGGVDEFSNLLVACRACHSHIHDHPAQSARLGFIIRRSSPNY